VLGNLSGWFYSAPPLRLAYRGLGEFSMILSVGLLIPGLGYLVTNGQMNQDGLFFMVPLMLYGLAFILTVEIPDMEADRLGDKRTWVAQKGRGFGFTVIAASFLLATIFFFCIPWLTSRVYPLDFRFLGSRLLPPGAGYIGMLNGTYRAIGYPGSHGIMIACSFRIPDGYLVYLAIHSVL
jgi:1,4-dihydroxy-2-naphthoate octaprenyltransferase